MSITNVLIVKQDRTDAARTAGIPDATSNETSILAQQLQAMIWHGRGISLDWKPMLGMGGGRVWMGEIKCIFAGTTTWPITIPFSQSFFDPPAMWHHRIDTASRSKHLLASHHQKPCWAAYSKLVSPLHCCLQQCRTTQKLQNHVHDITHKHVIFGRGSFLLLLILGLLDLAQTLQHVPGVPTCKAIPSWSSKNSILINNLRDALMYVQGSWHCVRWLSLSSTWAKAGHARVSGAMPRLNCQVGKWQGTSWSCSGSGSRFSGKALVCNAAPVWILSKMNCEWFELYVWGNRLKTTWNKEFKAESK